MFRHNILTVDYRSSMIVLLRSWLLSESLQFFVIVGLADKGPYIVDCEISLILAATYVYADITRKTATKAASVFGSASSCRSSTGLHALRRVRPSTDMPEVGISSH
jgi:hypothetical protein